MFFSKITSSILSDLQKALGNDCVFTDVETLKKHSRDQSKDFAFLPDVVVKPRNTEGVSQLIKICDAANIPVTWATAICT
jgi:glycolate oxidase